MLGNTCVLPEMGVVDISLKGLNILFMLYKSM